MTKEKRKPGRPTLDPGGGRAQTLSVRVPPDIWLALARYGNPREAAREILTRFVRQGRA